MFHPRQIIYFTPFYFKNGNPCKDKYFVVLARIDNKTVIASLPTRTNNVPSFVDKEHGCINHDDNCYNAYVFKSGKIVGESGFFFPDPKPTFIYGNQVDDYELEMLEDNYTIEGVDFEIKDILVREEYEALIQCLLISKSVKRKIKRLLPGF